MESDIFAFMYLLGGGEQTMRMKVRTICKTQFSPLHVYSEDQIQSHQAWLHVALVTKPMISFSSSRFSICT